jgi:hypothetical protein
LPGLFLWIKKLKGALVSKFTLYFFDILNKHSNYDMKSHSMKLPVDFYGKLVIHCLYRGFMERTFDLGMIGYYLQDCNISKEK